MQSWKNFTAQLPPVDVSGLSKNLRNTVQATRYVNINQSSGPFRIAGATAASSRDIKLISGSDLEMSDRTVSPSEQGT